jgi:hypothetical protein
LLIYICAVSVLCVVSRGELMTAGHMLPASTVYCCVAPVSDISFSSLQRTPCDLSVLLLTELKEIIKTYCQSPAGAKNSKKTSHTFCKVTTTLFPR